MKILASGDHHFDEQRRFEECIHVHQSMVELAHEHRVDCFISCGDIYERASTPRERQEASRWLIAMAEVCTTLVVKGNHDRDLDCAIMGRLRSKHPIIVEEACGVHYVGDAAIALIAWPERARILAAARAGGADPDELAQDALRRVFRGLAQQLSAHEGPKIAAGHFMVDGCVTSVGQPLVGMPMFVGLADLDLLQSDVVLMGHIHKPQDWTHNSTPMIYTGSPYRTSYGELEDKSVVLVEFPDELQIFWQRIATPCAGMFLVEDSWEDGEFVGGAHGSPRLDQLAGSEIRFRYKVQPDDRFAAALAAEAWKQDWLKLGALDVKVEPEVATTTRARAPEIATAVTLGDKLSALWKARGNVPEPPRSERLIRMAGELERDA